VFCSKEKLLAEVERVRHEPGAKHRNRLGILLGNTKTKDTKTLTHTLWSLLNVLPAGDWQRPHKHNSVALDLAVHAAPGKQTPQIVCRARYRKFHPLHWQSEVT
jgi:gentisate 1,2-dioxygenase